MDVRDKVARVTGGASGLGLATARRLAAEGMQFMSFYAQPSCTPGRAAILTGRRTRSVNGPE